MKVEILIFGCWEKKYRAKSGDQELKNKQRS